MSEDTPMVKTGRKEGGSLGSVSDERNIRRDKDGLPRWDPPGGEVFVHSHIPDGPGLNIEQEPAGHAASNEVQDAIRSFAKAREDLNIHDDRLLPPEHSSSLAPSLISGIAEVRARRRAEGKLALSAIDESEWM